MPQTFSLIDSPTLLENDIHVAFHFLQHANTVRLEQDLAREASSPSAELDSECNRVTAGLV